MLRAGNGDPGAGFLRYSVAHSYYEVMRHGPADIVPFA
jgi:hypothetical protein